jgi:hypothetical protein
MSRYETYYNSERLIKTLVINSFTQKKHNSMVISTDAIPVGRLLQKKEKRAKAPKVLGDLLPRAEARGN